MPDATPRVAVFDAYGTLFDVHAAVGRHADIIGPEAGTLSETWRAKQLEYSWVHGLMRRPVAFWDLTERALDYALETCPQVDRALRRTLLDAYRDLDAYPEVPGTLRALRDAGWRTAILSNGDAAMLERAVASAGLADHLDAVLSVESARTFKTDPEAYRIATAQFGTAPEGVLFCSSNRWDVAGAAAFGFRPVWVNRRGQPDEYPDSPPERVVRSLDALLGPPE